MLYISLALIFLGLLIFIYSIIVDAKKRHEEPHSPGGSDAYPQEGDEPKGIAPSGTVRKEQGPPARAPGAGRKPEPSPRRAAPAGTGIRPAPASPPREPEPRAVLYEDSSRVIDYSTGTGTIDPSLERYRNIKRIGSGRFAVGKSGITFQAGSTLYRYDFHRLHDLKQGSRHIALFLGGSESVRLFIFDSENGLIGAASDAYREYLRSSA